MCPVSFLISIQENNKKQPRLIAAVFSSSLDVCSYQVMLVLVRVPLKSP